MPRPVARRAGPGRWAGLALLAAAVLARAAVADPPDPQAPPPPKELSLADSKRVDELSQSIDALWRAGKFAEAMEPARQAAAICEKALGPDHWRTADARRQVEIMNTIAGLSEEGRQAIVTVPALDRECDDAYGKARYADAERLARQSLEVRLRWLGAGHPDTATSYNNLAEVLRTQGKLGEAEALHRRALAVWLTAVGEVHPDTATSYNNLAEVLRAQGKLGEAEDLQRRALAITLKAVGADHSDTAISYNNLAAVLHDQGKLGEAEKLYRRALPILLKVVGEGHPDTATSYNNLAEVLRAQGKLGEAEELQRRALAIRLKAVGAGHPATSTSYNNLAEVLRAQGKLGEAEALHRRALAILLKAVGAGQPDTATSYNNLAEVLRAQGKLGEAEALYRRALAIRLTMVGADHPNTATGYNNLAAVLRAEGKLGEAEALYRRALAIRLTAVGADHPDTAAGYNNLAVVLRAQLKLGEAEALYHRALTIGLKAMGEGHPDSATSYNNLAEVLRAQGRLGEAEALYRRALAIRLTALGAGHADTALSYYNLGQTLDRLGKADEALDTLTSAVDANELARLRRAGGLESALRAVDTDPSPALAVALARAGRGVDAWGRWERGLARAVLDEAAGRAARPLTPGEREREVDLLWRSQAVDEQIGRLLGQPRPNQQAEKRLDELRRQAGELRGQLLEFQQGLEQKYGPLAGQPVALDEARAILSENAALIGWVDTAYRHAACVVRRSGDPVWVLIPGTGEKGDWTKDEETLARQFRAALATHTTADTWRPLAVAVAKQRLGPVETHLKGVHRVVVVNSPGVAGVPVEVLFAARRRTGEPAPAVAYAPSASMLVHLARRARPADRPAALLAVGNPAYPEPNPTQDQAPAPPDHGLFVVDVVPNGNAHLFGVCPGDVLLEYNGTTLNIREDLKPVAAAAGPKRVPLRLWRAGEVRSIEITAGPLGVRLDTRPAAPIVLAQRAADEVLRGTRGDPGDLAGTGREIAEIAGLFPAAGVKTLLGDEARESVVQDLAHSGKLKGYRFLHFAAHGRDDPRSAYHTALILAPDPARPPDPTAFETDGEISALQIARTWDLDADLVVLSACESALGRQAGGEGFLGFAPPLLAKGARSLVLSLWKVDDTATALLMTRFYRNLLGRREGLSAPMPKAEALAEAKWWLSRLGRDVALDLAGRLDEAAERSKGARRRQPAGTPPVIPPGLGDERPYAHPYYWAAFILVGDPD